MKSFDFKLENTWQKSRAGVFKTAHGSVKTPVFMPVGTRATVKSLITQDLEALGASIILGNTYHLYLRPGAELIAELGGLHRFMQWPGPILTDSGGFQVLSLGDQVKIEESGVEFRSHLDGSTHFFTPTKSIEIQRQLGADIIMAFDECTPDKADEKYSNQALDRTHRWAQESFDYWHSQERLSHQGHYQALFGIIQGAMHPQLRKESAGFITSLDFDGIAVGGETIGYNMTGTEEMMKLIEADLPANKPRYAMGLGRDPEDIVRAVQMGFDMFDCVGPTRLARNGALFHGHLEIKEDGFEFVSEFKNGRLNIRRSQYKQDDQPIMTDCDCATCQAGYTRAYLNHLFKVKELSYYSLASIHNLRMMQRLTEQMRTAILTAK